MRTRIIIVGGFLGAGKTSLLWKAADRLIAMGMSVGLVTNDQAPDLVDTALLREKGLNVREVAGSCFCCNFQALIQAAGGIDTIRKTDVVIAEPVGSCTDLSATLLQPLKELFPDDYDLSPLSVLADPFLLKEILSGTDAGMHPDTAYIYRKQIEEADTILVGKVDLLEAAHVPVLVSEVSLKYPGAAVRRLSCATGEGIDEWLSEALSRNAAGMRIAEIDYDRYASGEAVLGWLNAEIRLSRSPYGLRDGGGLVRSLMEGLKDAFASMHAPIGHVKAILRADGGVCTANLTGSRPDVEIRGEISGSPSEGILILNARVETSPDDLRRAVLARLERLAENGATAVEIRNLRCFSPARPVPTYRYPAVVPSRKK
jgi:Ni2+-binding GTPase involved in maturation of urease and hydrogenase